MDRIAEQSRHFHVYDGIGPCRAVLHHQNHVAAAGVADCISYLDEQCPRSAAGSGVDSCREVEWHGAVDTHLGRSRTARDRVVQIFGALLLAQRDGETFGDGNLQRDVFGHDDRGAVGQGKGHGSRIVVDNGCALEERIAVGAISTIVTVSTCIAGGLSERFGLPRRAAVEGDVPIAVLNFQFRRDAGRALCARGTSGQYRQRGPRRTFVVRYIPVVVVADLQLRSNARSTVFAGSFHIQRSPTFAAVVRDMPVAVANLQLRRDGVVSVLAVGTLRFHFLTVDEDKRSVERPVIDAVGVLLNTDIRGVAGSSGRPVDTVSAISPVFTVVNHDRTIVGEGDLLSHGIAVFHERFDARDILVTLHGVDDRLQCRQVGIRLCTERRQSVESRPCRNLDYVAARHRDNHVVRIIGIYILKDRIAAGQSVLTVLAVLTVLSDGFTQRIAPRCAIVVRDVPVAVDDRYQRCNAVGTVGARSTGSPRSTVMAVGSVFAVLAFSLDLLAVDKNEFSVECPVVDAVGILLNTDGRRFTIDAVFAVGAVADGDLAGFGEGNLIPAAVGQRRDVGDVIVVLQCSHDRSYRRDIAVHRFYLLLERR